MIGRADIERSKSNVAMNAWLPQASYYTYLHGVKKGWTFRVKIPVIVTYNVIVTLRAQITWTLL